MSAKEVLMAAAGSAADAAYIEDVFSTYLYTGNGALQTINNGIDLAGKGGLVWTKSRSTVIGHRWESTPLGTDSLDSSSASGPAAGGSFQSYDASGYTLNGTGAGLNGAAAIYASWTFRKQPKFFDVLTYTGTGANRTVAHNLGSVPGCIIVKRTDIAADWQVYHRSLANTEYLVLNSTAAQATGTTRWNSTTPTSTVFSLGTDTTVNASGGTYVAYLFAHNAGGFGLTGTDDGISCGSFTTDASANPVTVNLGWEPQFVITKRVSLAGPWNMLDTMRGFSQNTVDAALFANNSGSESSVSDYGYPTATGFYYNGEGGANTTLIYIAIRRPNKPPTSGTQVFQPTVYTGTNVDNRLVDTTIAPDMVFVRQRNDTVLAGMVVGDRLRGQPYFVTGAQAAEVTAADALDQQIVSTVEYGTAFSAMNGFWCGNNATAKLNINTTSNNHIAEAFKRAPGFFDAACYTGNGTNQTIAHNLTVAPELIIVKRRDNSTSGSAGVYVSSVGNAQIMVFTDSDTPSASAAWNSTSPTSSVFSVGFGGNAKDKFTNTSAGTYVAYLFATCPGVSKVFSYTGNGTSQTIDCGFTTGARFVLIKRTNTTGDWYVWDSARGIVAGNDPHLSLNTIAAEVTTDDSVDTDTAGFIVNQLAATNVNVNLGTYIGLAIA